MKHAFWPNQKGYRDIELGLNRTYEILSRIGNPHEKLPKVIHVAGTNGKGSVMSFLKAILEANNQKVHCYSSPHLSEINERIILNSQKISDDFLSKCLNICQEACEKEPKLEPTYFEGLTIAAFLAFSKVQADFLLLEVGMGGRLDSTNVIARPEICIISPISYDHTDFLGDTIEKIAYEKAGIIKQNRPVFISKQNKIAANVIKKKAEELNSQTFFLGQDFYNEINSNSWNIKTKSTNCNISSILDIDFPNFLIGSHQVDNATLALFALKHCFSHLISDNKAKLAIKNTKWPARLEKIESGVYYEYLNKKLNQENKEFDLILDGSHNAQGSEIVREFLSKNSNKKRIVIFSMLKDKDINSFLSNIKNEIELLIAINIENENNCFLADEINDICKKLSIKTKKAGNFEESFAIIGENSSDENLILICGSLYSAGNFIDQNSHKIK